MIIQLILTLGLGLCLLYALAERKRSRLLSALLLGTVLTGLYLVWLPEYATVAAQLIGVGRGADLLLYCWIMISLVIVLHMRLKIHATNVIVTELARVIALQQPCRPAGADERAASGPTGAADAPGAAGPTASGCR